ncbi:K(+)-transporting ATPase subunit F [Marinobacter halodurans]|uniref:K(+)-transporting ATPase subunit F n=1 Tax=Marinobacter halodurans TaxID=2528979 RepID=A0ABY1ZTP0_9GAMM|nr:K(+)-transporting ATPase subunit F [Marinobacter halodurans]
MMSRPLIEGATSMSIFLLVLSLAVGAYLVAALLWPERF